MADPPFKPFEGAGGDAEILRRKKRQVEDVILDFMEVPRTTVIRDPARRERLAHSTDEVLGITAKLALLQEAVPAGLLRNIIIFFSGVKKTPEGDTKVTPGTAGNLAPSPVGYLDPTTVGLKRNFYLPPGSSRFVPNEAEQLGLGFKEQRQEDFESDLKDAMARSSSLNNTLRQIVENESTATLEDLVSGRGGFTRAGVIRAKGVGDTKQLELAAAVELSKRRAAPTLVQSVLRIIPHREGGPIAIVDAAEPVDTLPHEVQHATAIDRLFAANPPDP